MYVKRLTNRFIQLFSYLALVSLCFIGVVGVTDQVTRADCSEDTKFWTAMNKVWVQFNAEKEESLLISAWLAESSEQRARGFQGVCQGLLMERSLLFSFPVPVHANFHMAGVAAPLDIAFIDVSRQVIDIQRMTRQESNHPIRYYRPKTEFHYALETMAGRLDQLRKNPGLWSMRVSSRNQ